MIRIIMSIREWINRKVINTTRANIKKADSERLDREGFALGIWVKLSSQFLETYDEEETRYGVNWTLTRKVYLQTSKPR